MCSSRAGLFVVVFESLVRAVFVERLAEHMFEHAVTLECVFESVLESPCYIFKCLSCVRERVFEHACLLCSGVFVFEAPLVYNIHIHIQTYIRIHK